MSLILDIEKRAGDFHLKADLKCGDEVLALLGASGCGKSMTLRCIAGIDRPDRGRIVLNDRVLFDSEKKINVSAQKRRTGLLFQNYALFPNMTVEKNIRLGSLRDRNAETDVRKILERFHLTEVAGLYPSQLSGGQQQRTALARILLSQPDILLLDEPFSALDSHLRFRMEEEIREVIRSFQKTVILVSHNRDEVFRLSDRVAILKDGSVDRIGSREDVFRDPMTKNAAVLTGCKNVSPVEITDDKHLLATDFGMILAVPKIPEDTRYVGIRMHHIYPGDGENAFDCTVTEEIENPFSYTLMLKKTGADNVKPFGFEVGKEVWNKCRAHTVRVHIPGSSLHFLRE
ncbi:MAG: ATP-binding cassette domain-containing protein [Lachnospiraceae bacterium]|nr:ATP-binding cassette domain-containing protein [Lachnospiraceae bacterium]